jgi:hypothetical protein
VFSIVVITSSARGAREPDGRSIVTMSTNDSALLCALRASVVAFVDAATVRVL